MTDPPKSHAILVSVIVLIDTGLMTALMLATIVYTYGLGLYAYAMLTVTLNLVLAIGFALAAALSRAQGWRRACALAFGMATVIAAVLSLGGALYVTAT